MLQWWVASMAATCGPVDALATTCRHFGCRLVFQSEVVPECDALASKEESSSPQAQRPPLVEAQPLQAPAADAKARRAFG